MFHRGFKPHAPDQIGVSRPIGLSLDELLMSLRTKFLDRYGYQTENRKNLSLSAIFLIYSIFSNRIQMSLHAKLTIS